MFRRDRHGNRKPANPFAPALIFSNDGAYSPIQVVFLKFPS
jgi:hypothetical protein